MASAQKVGQTLTRLPPVRGTIRCPVACRLQIRSFGSTMNGISLGVHLAGAVDVNDPQFAESDLVTSDGFEARFKTNHYSLSTPEVVAKKPRRPLPDKIQKLLLAVERAQSPGEDRLDLHRTQLAESGLGGTRESLSEARKKAGWYGRAHAAALHHPWRRSGGRLRLRLSKPKSDAGSAPESLRLGGQVRTTVRRQRYDPQRLIARSPSPSSS